MKNMKKVIALVLATIVCIASACVLTSCGENKKLVIGITDYEPMNYKDKDGEWIGFDTEFAQAFGKANGYDVEFIEIDWDNKYIELNAGSIDCIWNGMTITDEAKKNSDVSDPYAKDGQVLVMKKGADSSKLDDLKFTAEAGSAGEKVIKEKKYKNYTAIGTQTNAIMEVSTGSSDACVVDATLAKSVIGDGTSYENLEVVNYLTEDQFGVSFKKDSELTEKFNTYLADSIKDKSLAKLADKYGVVLIGE